MATNLSHLITDLRDLADRCLYASVADAVVMVRELQNFVGHLPSAEHFGVRARTDGELFESRLNVGCGLEACLMMLDPKVGYMLSRGGAGLSYATVVFLTGDKEYSSSGDSDALALIGAIATGLSEVFEAEPLL